MNLNSIIYIESKSFNPYINLSLEEIIMNKKDDRNIYFYLWQNNNTVVIGKNQCAKEQCNLNLMKKDNIKLARRSSGGGAVFHDLGNLNFTFIFPNDFFDIKKNLNVIKKALSYFGINAYFSGRNDLLVDGYKVSGQAYLKKGNISLHHGTLLVNTSLENLSRYLKTDIDKLKSHGVKSHSQRVANLITFNDKINIETIKLYLKQSIIEEFNLPLIDNYSIDNYLIEKYQNQEWLYRLNTNGQRMTKRFDYGLIDLYLQIIDRKICKVEINSDVMDLDIIEEIKECLINKEVNSALFCKIKLRNKQIENDIISLLEENLCMI